MAMLESLGILDDALSKRLFQMRLPKWLTWIYSVPACFFGIPALIGGPLLALAGSSVQEEAPIFWSAWGVTLLLGYIVLFYSVMGKVEAAKNSTDRDEAMRAAYVVFDFQFHITASTMLLAYKIFRPAVQGIQFFAFSTLFTQIFIVVLKRGACRTRPCMRPFPAPLPVRSPPLSAFVSSTKHAKESFPSGDAAEAVIFAATLYRHGRPLWLCISIVLLSASGRVYFHAHHLGDVIAGVSIAGIGCAVTSLLVTAELDWWVLPVTLAAFIGLEKVIRKLSAHRHKKGKGA
jgi:membrane-associated phospholipid phosphatase